MVGVEPVLLKAHYRLKLGRFKAKKKIFPVN